MRSLYPEKARAVKPEPKQFCMAETSQKLYMVDPEREIDVPFPQF